MIFNINFFLFSFAQSCIWSYPVLIAKHYAAVSNNQYSVLALILPAFALFAKPIACSVTDARGIHKQFLIGSYGVFASSYAIICGTVCLKDPQSRDYDTLVWIIMIICLAFGWVASACAFCMNDALASNYARKNNQSYSVMRIWSNIGWAAGALVLMFIGDASWAPYRVPSLVLLVLTSVVNILFIVLWPYEEDFEMFHDGTTVEQRKLSIVGPKTLEYLAQNKPRGSISRDILEKIKAGRSKSVGNLPRIGGSLKPLDFKEQTKQEPAKKPEEVKEYSNFHCQMILLKMIALSHKSFSRYILLFTIFGMVQGAVWTFQLDYIESEITHDAANFEFISNLSKIAQALLGEIPINAVASGMIRIFGANANMSLALVTIGMRCMFYSELLPYLGPKSIVFAEALQGPSLGLYWILIVEVGSNYALMVTDYMPELKRRGIVRDRAHEEELNGCLRASMIGMMSSSMEGLGLAVGSFLAGIISSSKGYHWMWNACAVAAIGLGFINIGWDVLKKLILNKKQQTKKKDTEVSGQGIPVIAIDSSSKL